MSQNDSVCLHPTSVRSVFILHMHYTCAIYTIYSLVYCMYYCIYVSNAGESDWLGDLCLHSTLCTSVQTEDALPWVYCWYVGISKKELYPLRYVHFVWWVNQQKRNVWNKIWDMCTCLVSMHQPPGLTAEGSDSRSPPPWSHRSKLPFLHTFNLSKALDLQSLENVGLMNLRWRWSS